MTDLTKIAGSQKHRSSLGVGEMSATAAVLLLLIAVQGMFRPDVLVQLRIVMTLWCPQRGARAAGCASARAVMNG